MNANEIDDKPIPKFAFENNNFDEINKRINSVWEDLGVKVTVKKLNIDTKGAIILS